MKSLLGVLVAGLSLALVAPAANAQAATVSAANADGTPQLLTELQFSSTTAMASAASTAITSSALSPAGWLTGAQAGGSVGVQSTASPQASAPSVDTLEGSYPVPGAGAQFIWADYSVAALNTEDVYVEFWAKMPSQYKGGCKFLKVFGERSDPSGDADATIATDYTGVDYGAIRQISFGDGTGVRNDSQNTINLDGTNPSWIGRSYGSAVVKTPQGGNFSSADWGTQWHHFRVHVKFNSGTTSKNEVADGAYYLEIDNQVYVDATGLYNRNPANGPISYIEFFGWAQKDPQPFQLWYDDIRISTGGFLSTPLPDPPADIGAQVQAN